MDNIIIKVRDLEEKNRLLKDRTLLIGENLVETKEDIEKDISEIKRKLIVLEDETAKIKSILEMLMENLDNFARKSHLDIIEKQMKMFSPLDLVRKQDIEEIINEKLKKNKQ